MAAPSTASASSVSGSAFADAIPARGSSFNDVEDMPLDVFDEQMEAFRAWLKSSGIWKKFLDSGSTDGDSGSMAPAAPLDMSCPGITYEFDVRPEHEARFNTVVSVLGPLLQQLHKINPLVLSSQLISSRPLVWVERYHSDEAMERAIGPLCSRDYCVSDEEHLMRSTYVSGMRQIAKLRRVVALGELSAVTSAIVRGTVYGFGGASALPLLRTLPVLYPAWVNRLTHSGEVVALHSLSANSAADTTAIPGATIAYTVRDVHGEQLVALTKPFVYDVLAEFGGEHAGRAIAVRPRHKPRAVYICFRGVRRVRPDCAHEADRQAVVTSEMERRPWLDALSRAGKQRAPPEHRARAGVLAHHEAIYDGSSGPSASGIGDVSDGAPGEVAAHASFADRRAPSLREWLARHSASPLGEEPAPRAEVVFVGFSLGGALAQMTALRAAHELPELAHRIRVLALGATQWASPALCTTFAHTMAAQAVLLLTASQDSRAVAIGGTQPSNPSVDPPADAPADHGSSTPSRRALWTVGGDAALVDPMSLGFTEQTAYTHNLILCETPTESAGKHVTALAASEARQPAPAPAPAVLSGRTRTLPTRRIVSAGSSSRSGVSESSAAGIGGGCGGGSGGGNGGAGPTLLRRGSAAPRRPAAKTASAARAIVRRVAETPVAESVAAGADSSVLALLASSESVSGAWPLLCGRNDSLLSLKRRRPDAAHEHAYHSYWAGSIGEQHPFVCDVRRLHTGRAYRSALIREHTRLRRWSTDATVSDRNAMTSPPLVEAGQSELPLAMLVDGAWECRAGVLYQVKQTLQGGPASFEAQPVDGMSEPKVMKRLASISSAMDELELSMC